MRGTWTPLLNRVHDEVYFCDRFETIAAELVVDLVLMVVGRSAIAAEAVVGVAIA